MFFGGIADLFSGGGGGGGSHTAPITNPINTAPDVSIFRDPISFAGGGVARPPTATHPITTQPFPPDRPSQPPLSLTPQEDTLPDLGGFLPDTNETDILNKQTNTGANPNNIVVATGGVKSAPSKSFTDYLQDPLVLAGGGAAVLLLLLLLRRE